MAESIIEINQTYQKAENAIWDYLIQCELGYKRDDIRDHLVHRYGVDNAALIIKAGNSLGRLTEQVRELEYALGK